MSSIVFPDIKKKQLRSLIGDGCMDSITQKGMSF